MPYRISPSRIARYFYLGGCERYLRYTSTPKGKRSEHGIPYIQDEAGSGSGRLIDAGYRWEEKVADSILGDKAIIAAAKPGTTISDREHGVAETLNALRDLKAGEYLYQPTIETPLRFYRHYGLDNRLVQFSRCRPDLILCREDESGKRKFQIIDIKASHDIKPSYRVQVACYALILRKVLSASSIDGEVDTTTGGVWLFNEQQPEWFDLSQPIEALETFFRDQLTPILCKPMKDIFWHVGFRCEWCAFFDHCRREADRTRSVSLIPRLTSHAKRFLKDSHWNPTKPVESLTDLKVMLSEPAKSIALNSCGSLRGKSDRLANHVCALETGEIVPHGGSTPMMPRMEHVRIILVLETDPLSGKLYAAGYFRKGGADVFGNDEREEIFVAATPEVTSDILTSFIKVLHQELADLHDHNAHKEWKERRSLQCYLFDHYERWIFSDLLIEVAQNPATAKEAVPLLEHFQNAELFSADYHPCDEKCYPLVVLTSVINETLALPYPFFTRLKDVAEIMQHPDKKIRYEPDETLCFQLSNRIRGDAILKVWDEKNADLLEMIREEVQQRLHAVDGIIDGLRHELRGKLFAWAERFSFPAQWNLKTPELSKLVFAVAHESLSNAMAIKARRSLPWAERLRDEIAIPLRFIGGDHWSLENPITGENIGADGFSSNLIAPNDFRGDMAQMAFNDTYYRDKVWGARGLVRFAGIDKIYRDRSGMVTALDLSIRRGKDQSLFYKGDQAVLYERAVDFLSKRLIRRLQEIDEEPEPEFLSVLLPNDSNYEQKCTRAPLIAPLIPRGTALTVSQKRAVRHFLENELSLIWGPPGTGKTHSLSMGILILAAAHIESGQTLSVAITSLAHAGIENALLKVAQLIPHFDLQEKIGLYKLGHVHLMKAETLPVVSAQGASDLYGRHPVLIIGGTAYALEKAIRKGMKPCDVLVIDEASQLKLPEVALAMMAKKKGGRLLVVGDDMQLPPITGADFPKPENGDPWLMDSIFGFLKSKDTAGKQYTVQLFENFRMNETLTKFPATNIYGDQYRPATNGIAHRRLRLKPRRNSKPPTVEEEFTDWILDPRWPMVLIIVEGVQAAVENPLEAEIVASLAVALRRQMFKEKSRRLYPRTQEGEQAFWTKGLFIVSPHHAQIRAIRRALAKRRRWHATPFVGTVEKLQGQESNCVIASYGVSDVETALFESEFIYNQNRLNVSLTRAKTKCIICLPRPLLAPHIDLLDDEEVMQGMTFMRNLEKFCQAHGEERNFNLDFIGDIGTGKKLTAIRARYSEKKTG